MDRPQSPFTLIYHALEGFHFPAKKVIYLHYNLVKPNTSRKMFYRQQRKEFNTLTLLSAWDCEVLSLVRFLMLFNEQTSEKSPIPNQMVLQDLTRVYMKRMTKKSSLNAHTVPLVFATTTSLEDSS